jgi:SET domain-containing protein
MDYAKILAQLKKTPRVHGYVHPNTKTKLSRIHGLGLFSNKNFKKNTVIAVWGGCIVTKKEIQKLPKSIGFNYALEIHPGFFIAETSEIELDQSDFINHSCSPNCKIINQLTMITKREIKKGEELTCDFSSPTKVKITCNCNSKNCKGFI